jgi:hypothetical protein
MARFESESEVTATCHSAIKPHQRTTQPSKAVMEIAPACFGPRHHTMIQHQRATPPSHLAITAQLSIEDTQKQGDS